MLKLAKFKPSRCNFCIQLTKGQNSDLFDIVRNGGIKTIDKNIINLYANSKISVAKETINHGN